MKISNSGLFLILLALQYLLIFLSDSLLINDYIIYDSLQHQLSYDRITELLEAGNSKKWITLALIPFRTLLKCFFVSICIYLGAFLSNMEINLSVFLRIAILAEFVVLLNIISKILWFTLVDHNYSLQDLHNFSPLSSLHLFNSNVVDRSIAFALKSLNIVELLYWLVLAHLLKDIIGRSFGSRFFFIARTYGLGLLVWLLTIIFILISIS